MNKLSAEAASVLEVARSEYTPSESHRRRLREGIEKRVAGAAAAASVSTSEVEAKAGGKGLWRAHGLKLVAISALVIGAFTASRYALSDDPRAPAPAERGPASPVNTERRAFEIKDAPSATVALRTEPTLSPDLLPDAPASEPPMKAPAEGARKVTPNAPIAPIASIAKASAGEAVDDVDTLGAEMRILREAHAALKSSDLPRARKALDEHAGTYPRGVLREERLALSALVLCGEGRRVEARKVAEELARQSPHSSHLERLRGSCAADPAE